MKRFKFTFALALSLLMLGAGWNKADAVRFIPNDIRLWMDIQPSPYYLVDSVSYKSPKIGYYGANELFNFGVTYQLALYSKTNPSVLVAPYFNPATDEYYPILAATPADAFCGDYRREVLQVPSPWEPILGGAGGNGNSPFASAYPNLVLDYHGNFFTGEVHICGDSVYHIGDESYMYYPTWDLSSNHQRLANLTYWINDLNLNLNFDFRINLTYVNGNSAYPFLKRTIYYIDENGAVQTQGFLVSPSSNNQWKPDWTYGSDIATYFYNTKISELLEQYQITDIKYEVWVSDDLFGDPFAMPQDNQAITIVSDEEDIEITAPYKIWLDQKFYVPSGKDFTFIVKADPTKKLTVDVPNNPYYMQQQGVIIKEAPEKDGTYNVTLKKVTFAIPELILGYEAGTESGPTGLVAPAVDKVYSAGGVLNVTSSTPGTLQVYTITGQLAKEIAVSGDIQVPLSKGLYIVKLNGKAYKVVL